MPVSKGSAGHWWCWTGILALFCILTIATARSVLPQPDEAVYANPGYNVLYNGHIGTTLYELRGFMPLSVLRITYFQFPLYFFVTPLWFKAVGFGVMQVRAFSIVFGILGVVSWYWIVRLLCGSATAGLVAMLLVSLDFFYMLGAATGRPDMFCAGLGAAALASYLLLRERSLVQALFASHVFATLSILAHPVGVLYWLGLVLLFLINDRRSISVKALAAAAVPAVAGLLLFGGYIAHDPNAFLEQMIRTLAINRDSFDPTGLSSNPLIRTVELEIRNRYIGPFGLGPGVGAAHRLKAVILTMYATAVLGSLLFQRLRRTPGLVQLSLLTWIAVLYLALVSPSKFAYYLPHVTSFMAACLGAFLYAARGALGRKGWLAGAALFLITGLQLAGILYRILQDPYHRNYLPVVELARQHTTPQSIIMASGEFWFGLEHDRYMIYDYKLGAASGTVPDLIVWASTERALHEKARREDPATFEHVQRMLDARKLIYEDSYYQVYLLGG